jgi:hypothetical protein
MNKLNNVIVKVKNTCQTFGHSTYFLFQVIDLANFLVAELQMERVFLGFVPSSLHTDTLISTII